MKIAIIGAGYVGLTSAAILADLGNTVWAVRKDIETIEMLKKGEVPFYEPGLAEIVKRNVQAGRLIPTIEYKEAVPQSEVVFICVGTPSLPNGEADLSQVFAAAEEIAQNLNGYKVIVDKSTVPIGTADQVRQIVEKNTPPGIEFDMASCPEFLREGNALRDTLNPDRIVIGTETDKARDLLIKLHEPLSGERVITNIKTAELIKYASNAFLATKISFINEIACLCETVGADVENVARGMGLDKRIGSSFLKAGIGWGGSCFPKDTRALYFIANDSGHTFSLLKAVIEVNNEQRHRFVGKLKNALGSLQGKTITVLGLAFKANTDDVRESASLEVIKLILREGAKIRAYDPIALKNAQVALQGVEDVVFCQDAISACQSADAVVILTEWEEFKNLDWSAVKKVLNQAIVVDGRNLLDAQFMKDNDFSYFSIGRQSN